MDTAAQILYALLITTGIVLLLIIIHFAELPGFVIGWSKGRDAAITDPCDCAHCKAHRAEEVCPTCGKKKGE
jgi:hypothetical protein